MGEYQLVIYYSQQVFFGSEPLAYYHFGSSYLLFTTSSTHTGTPFDFPRSSDLTTDEYNIYEDIFEKIKYRTGQFNPSIDDWCTGQIHWCCSETLQHFVLTRCSCIVYTYIWSSHFEKYIHMTDHSEWYTSIIDSAALLLLMNQYNNNDYFWRAWRGLFHRNHISSPFRFPDSLNGSFLFRFPFLFRLL